MTQGTTLVTYAANDYTTAVQRPDDHRTPVLCDSRSYEVTGLPAPGLGGRFAFDELAVLVDTQWRLRGRIDDVDLGVLDGDAGRAGLAPTLGRDVTDR